MNRKTTFRQQDKQEKFGKPLSGRDMAYSLLWCWKYKWIVSKLFGNDIYDRYHLMREKVKQFEKKLDSVNIINSIDELKATVKRIDYQCKYAISRTI